MFIRSLVRARLSAVAVVTAIPVSLAALAYVVPSTQSTAPSSASTVSAGVQAQPVERRTTVAGGLALRTKAERNRRIAVTSSKGSRVWTASALAEHDLPSAAMRAYKAAAATINAEQPGCHLPWTLLAGIGRVESDHGRYGGSTLGSDGVPRPAIVGVALNGVGPVAAIHDTDNGRFDGDTVWDRAVGPMQFIPSTWSGSGRDGDGDGLRSPNDIDDASLASAAYLCHGEGNLSSQEDQRAAIFSYNASDYYVDLVSAFARGYRTGTFVIPSPNVSPDAGDGVVHLAADDAAEARAAKKAEGKTGKAKATTDEATTKPVRRPHAAPKPRPTKPSSSTKPSKPSTSTKPSKPSKPSTSTKPSKPSKPSKPAPAPQPKLLTVRGPVVVVPGGWQVGTATFNEADLTSIEKQDWDNDGDTAESMAGELNGLATGAVSVTLTYYDEPAFKVNGFTVD